MKLVGTTQSFWFVRAPLAVLGGVVVGQIAQVPLALLLDVVWQRDVTGGRWPFNLPNILLACIVGILAGFVTGWIAGRRGKLLGAIAIFLPLWLLLTVTVIRNVDLTEYFEKMYDTRPALWAWIALAPGVVGGHFGALDGKGYFNKTALYGSAGFLWLASLGFSFFHFYTAFIAFERVGFMAATFTLGLPFVAELYWIWRIWNESGHFLNGYTSLILMLVVFLLIAGIWGIAYEKTKK